MTIDEIKRANDRAGFHFFEPDAMRFFRSRVLPTVYGEGYFVTSEQFVTHYPEYHTEPRAYTVRHALADGSISTVGEFQQYATAREAQKAAREVAAFSHSLP